MRFLTKSIWAIIGVSASISAIAAPKPPARPNIVVIVAYDLGYSDLGAFGGEFRTPRLDALARSRMKLTDFHASPTYSPDRSVFLHGCDNHTARVGEMAEFRSVLGGGAK